jgi:hypothetical protein
MTNINQSPFFVVVGHPNKGKSSIVSTLAQDDSVEIGAIPGTTTKSTTYPMSIDNVVLYSLIDTPGFQRPRKLLAWLKEKETTLANRPAIIRQFLENPKNRDQFPDEFELLSPLVTFNAGIVYVVDGSVPYSTDYETEMEILQWTGQPRLALINPIENSNFVEEWRLGLRHFFGIIKVFNPLSTPFEGRMELLRAFGQLNHEWQEPLEKAYEVLASFRQKQRISSSRLIAHSLVEVIKCQVSRTVSVEGSVEKATEELRAEFMNKLRKIEKQCWNNINSLYLQTKITVKNSEFEVLKSDLFSAESLVFFGLSRWQLLITGCVSGGTAGGLIDLAVGGSSFFIGTLLGASLGAITTQLTLQHIMGVKILSLPLGKKQIVLSLSKDVNLPFVFLARARFYHRMIENRSHGHRSTVELDQGSPPTLNQEELFSFGKLFAEIRTTSNLSKSTDALIAKINSL